MVVRMYGGSWGRRRKITPFLVAAIVAGIGAGVLLMTHAAGPTVSLETENSAIIGGASVVNDATASNSSAVKFATSIPASICPSYPAFPDANCVGWQHTGVTLMPYTGPTNITTANTVIDGKDIATGIVINAANVVIRNSHIHGSGDTNAVNVVSGNVTLYDTEIDGNFENAIGYDNWKGYRLNVHGTYGDGLKLGSNVRLEDSWIHDLSPGVGAHADGGQVQDGITNTFVIHNRIDPRAGANNSGVNAALFIAPDLGPNSNGPLVIDKNILGGGNYTLFCLDGNNGQYYINGITITNNHFIRNSYQYGPSSVNVPITQSGNVWADNGQALSL